MSRDIDPLLALAEEIAEGKEIDWPARLDGVDDASHGARLKRLAHMLDLIRSEGGPVVPVGGDPRTTRRWGHLQVGELLGSGSFGEVYRAYDPVLRRDVALKLRSRPRATASESTFLAEARRLARVRHPNVLAVHGADVHDGRAGLWADLLEGQTLEWILAERTPHAVPEVLGIALQLVGALAAVHDAGLVHGDVKASNVMSTHGARVVLMDFGSGSDAAAGTLPTAGSPLSMAPELFAGLPATAASDLYGLGVLLFRLLTGRYPIAADTLDELAAHHNDGWTLSWNRRDRIPRSLRHLVEKLLAPDPAARPTAPQALKALQSIEEQPRRRRWRMAVAVVITSTLAALGASVTGWISAKRATLRVERARAEAEATSKFLTNLLLAPDTTQRGPDVKVLDVMDNALSLADGTLADRPEIRGRILWLIGRVKESLGRGNEALDIFVQAEDAFSEVPGETARQERVEVRIRRSRLLAEQGETDAAEGLLREVGGEVDPWSPGSALHTELLRTSAYLLSQRGRQAEAAVVLRQALDALPEADESRFPILFELAIVLNRLGEVGEAETIYRRYLEWSRTRLGERHENTLGARYNLAGLVTQSGRFAEAEALIRQNVDVSREWLGREHRLHVLSLIGLAEVFSAQGRLSEADELSGQILPLAAQLWGPDHPRTLILNANIAVRKLRVGRYADAEALLVPAIDGLADRLGRNADAVLRLRMSMVDLLLETGRASQAAHVAGDAYERSLSDLGGKSPVTLGLAVRVGRAAAALGKFDEALPLLRSTLASQQEVLGRDQLETLGTQLALARVEAAAGFREEARRLLCDAGSYLRRVPGAEHLLEEVEAMVETTGGCSALSP